MYSLNLMSHRAGTGARRSRLRRRGQQVLGALPLHRQRHQPPGTTTAKACGTTRTASTTTCCTCRTAATCRLKVRSIVGLIPLFAVETMEPRLIDQHARLQAPHAVVHRQPPRPDPQCGVHGGARQGRAPPAFAGATRTSFAAILRRMLDEQEFLSPYGIRSLSRAYRGHPYVFSGDGTEHSVDYEPGESQTGLFGGNSNWRGPVWFPLNYLLIESLQRFHHYLGDDYKVECPSGSGHMMTLWEVAAEISRRLSRIVPQGREGPARGLRRLGHFPDGPTLARPGAVLRVLPRRHRRGPGRQPSDGLDGPGGQAAAAERGVSRLNFRPQAHWIWVITKCAETGRVPPANGVMVSAVEFPAGLRTVSTELMTVVCTRAIPVI